MRRKRILLIGARGAGKSALAGWLEGTDRTRRSTPVMVYTERTIEAPGAYLECPWMHCHLIAAAQDASLVLMLADASQPRAKRVYPPGFAQVFGPPVIGVVTKTDRDHGRAMECEEQLRQAGVRQVCHVSLYDETSLRALEQLLASVGAGEKTGRKGGS